MKLQVTESLAVANSFSSDEGVGLLPAAKMARDTLRELKESQGDRSFRTDWQRWRVGVDRGLFSGMHGHPEGPIRLEWWNTNWIPITANGGGDHDCVDLDPAEEGGVVGQVIEFNHETGARCVSASSFREFLSVFADALERGVYRYDEEARSLLPIDD